MGGPETPASTPPPTPSERRCEAPTEAPKVSTEELRQQRRRDRMEACERGRPIVKKLFEDLEAHAFGMHLACIWGDIMDLASRNRGRRGS